jgi:hypothetical protein
MSPVINRWGLAALFLGMSCLLFACKKDDRALVVGKIQNAADLATTEFVVDKIVFGTKTKKLALIKVSEATFMAYSQAKIKTGIDLNKIKENDIRIEGRKIFVRLPAIEVINFSYPPSSFVADSTISDPKVFLNRINVRDQEQFFRDAELDIRDNIQYMGLVRTSQNNTRQLFRVLLSSLGYDEIYISFESDALVLSKVNLLADPDSLAITP